MCQQTILVRVGGTQRARILGYALSVKATKSRRQVSGVTDPSVLPDDFHNLQGVCTMMEAYTLNLAGEGHLRGNKRVVSELSLFRFEVGHRESRYCRRNPFEQFEGLCDDFGRA